MPCCFVEQDKDLEKALAAAELAHGKFMAGQEEPSESALEALVAMAKAGRAHCLLANDCW